MKYNVLVISSLIILIGASACQSPSGPRPGETIQLATYRENFVEVGIKLENKGDGQIFLSATFIPLLSDLHFYSKDIPKNGANGLGRPTLLEIASDSLIKTSGNLLESVPSQIPDFEPKNLLVYPPGAITLSLPIILPEGDQWFNDRVLVTYMACNERGCRPPVEGKVIPIQIPGDNLIP
jgi:hypothetical protein